MWYLVDLIKFTDFRHLCHKILTSKLREDQSECLNSSLKENILKKKICTGELRHVLCLVHLFSAAIPQSVWRLATGWATRASNPGGGEIFRTRPDWPWGPPSLLYNGGRVSFPGIKRRGHCVNHALPSSAEVKERVELSVLWLVHSLFRSVFSTERDLVLRVSIYGTGSFS